MFIAVKDSETVILNRKQTVYCVGSITENISSYLTMTYFEEPS